MCEMKEGDVKLKVKPKAVENEIMLFTLCRNLIFVMSCLTEKIKQVKRKSPLY